MLILFWEEACSGREYDYDLLDKITGYRRYTACVDGRVLQLVRICVR